MVGSDDRQVARAPRTTVDDPERRARRFAEINEHARRAFLEGAAEEWQ